MRVGGVAGYRRGREKDVGGERLVKQKCFGEFMRDWYWCLSRRTCQGTEKTQRKRGREKDWGGRNGLPV